MFANLTFEFVSGIVKGLGTIVGSVAIPFLIGYVVNKAKTTLLVEKVRAVLTKKK
ncbi:hypothetical protein [Bacillus thuringiensis]|uniref:hypothetical protein n=1 Tax=Bacillus thuringiensis TaxID=1428 RepID=UPI0015970FAD|nr:hypothetical protein [Bacillus thuringiensis]MED3476531.1 hypothetical protein [Bacillus thuringiensis]MED3632969.1 hypothetical protein [Bacillus thuringiensis]HDR8041847.1 hypothetical protein [Bacillus cereus]